MNVKSLSGAAAVALTAALMSVGPVSAATISGQLDLTGIINVDNSIFEPGGFVDFDPNTTDNVVIAAGDFAAFGDETFTLFDIDLTAPDRVYTATDATGTASGDVLTFTATSYLTFDNSTPSRGLAAVGVLTLDGFDSTPGLLTLTTQENNPNQVIASFSSTTTVIPLPASALLLLSGLGALSGLGVARRRSAPAAA